ncbi:MAG: OmpA family protein [Parvibaculaceae bacterium]|nr:OmpA family protein [Parvibaculaceae bacterium]
MSASLNNGSHSFEPQAQETAMGHATGALMRRAARATAAALLLAGLAACSTTPDWAKPDFIYGDDLSQSSGAGTQFPALAEVPETPTVSTTAEERAELTESLAADRVRARYTDEVLRGGTQTPAIAPVVPASVPVSAPTNLDQQSQIVPSARMAAAKAAEKAQPTLAELRAASTSSARSEASKVAAKAAPIAETQVQTAAAEPMSAVDKMLSYRGGRSAAAQSRTITSDTSTSAADRLMTASQAEVQPVMAKVAATQAAVPAVPSTRMAKAMVDEGGMDARISAVSPVRSAPATRTADVPIYRAPTVQAQVKSSPVVTSATFQASQAPALTRESLAMAGNVASTRYQQTHETVYVGGSDSDNGAVTINMDALNYPSKTASSARKAVAAPVGAVAVYDGQGGPGNIPPYVLQFEYGSAALTAADRAALSEVLPAVGVYGETVRIVGHASQQSGQQDDSKAKWANFSLSMQRAEAVAMELAAQGVAAKRIIVEAAGDSVPVYYQSAMPSGEPGDRRVEIFIE